VQYNQKSYDIKLSAEMSIKKN